MSIVLRKNYDKLLLFVVNVLPYSRTETLAVNYLEFFDLVNESNRIVKQKELDAKNAKAKAAAQSNAK